MKKMKHPCLHDTAERLERRPAEGEADHRVVARFALPVKGGVGAIEHVKVYLPDVRLCLDDEPPDAAVAIARSVHLHRLEVGEQHVAVADRRLLLAKEKLCGAQLERIFRAVENAA